MELLVGNLVNMVETEVSGEIDSVTEAVRRDEEDEGSVNVLGAEAL